MRVMHFCVCTVQCKHSEQRKYAARWVTCERACAHILCTLYAASRFFTHTPASVYIYNREDVFRSMRRLGTAVCQYFQNSIKMRVHFMHTQRTLFKIYDDYSILMCACISKRARTTHRLRERRRRHQINIKYGRVRCVARAENVRSVHISLRKKMKKNNPRRRRKRPERCACASAELNRYIFSIVYL